MKKLSYPDYSFDYYGWLVSQTLLLKDGKLNILDTKNLLEEMELLAGNVRSELVNRLAVLIAHLLKWKFQQEYRSKSWQITIKEQRRAILILIKRNPSLKSFISIAIEDAYSSAVLIAERETQLPEETFPIEFPFSYDECIDSNFWPE